MRTFKVFVPQLTASRSDDGRRVLHGVMSSTIKDLHGDVMTLSALQDMERSARGKTFFLNHSYTVPEDVGGTIVDAAIKMWPDGTGADVPITVEVNEVNPRAVQAHESIENGAGLGISIGAVIPDGGAKRDKKSGGYVIEHVELLEASLVGIPANPRSWVEYAVKSLKGVDDMVSEQVIEEEETYTVLSIETDDVLEETIEPEVVDSTSVTVETEDGTISVELGGESAEDEPTSQDALESIPEDEEGALLEAVLESYEEVPVDVRHLVHGNALLASLMSELVGLRKRVDSAEKERDEAVVQRDEAIVLAQRALTDTASILSRLSASPAGRRAVVRETEASFAHLSGVYSEEFLKMLRSK